MKPFLSLQSCALLLLSKKKKLFFFRARRHKTQAQDHCIKLFNHQKLFAKQYYRTLLSFSAICPSSIDAIQHRHSQYIYDSYHMLAIFIYIAVRSKKITVGNCFFTIADVTASYSFHDVVCSYLNRKSMLANICPAHTQRCFLQRHTLVTEKTIPLLESSLE